MAPQCRKTVGIFEGHPFEGHNSFFNLLYSVGEWSRCYCLWSEVAKQKQVPFSLIADGTIWISSVEERMCSSVACVAAKVDPDLD